MGEERGKWITRVGKNERLVRRVNMTSRTHGHDNNIFGRGIIVILILDISTTYYMFLSFLNKLKNISIIFT